MQTSQVVLDIFTIATAVGVLMQAFILLGLYLVVKKTTDKVIEVTDQIKQHIVPTLTVTRNLVEDISPKVKTVTSNLVDASSTLRSQAEHIHKTVADVTGKAQAQATRVDEMATAVLDGVTQATATVQHGIATPLKQVSGVLNGLRAGLEVLRKKERPTHVDADGNGSNFV